MWMSRHVWRTNCILQYQISLHTFPFLRLFLLLSLEVSYVPVLTILVRQILLLVFSSQLLLRRKHFTYLVFYGTDSQVLCIYYCARVFLRFGRVDSGDNILPKRTNESPITNCIRREIVGSISASFHITVFYVHKRIFGP